MTTVNLTTMTDEEVVAWGATLPLEALRLQVEAYGDVRHVPTLGRVYDLLVRAYGQRQVRVTVNGHTTVVRQDQWDLAMYGVPANATVTIEEVEA